MSAQQSSLNDVFRFITLRGVAGAATPILLLDTQYAVTLGNTPKHADRQRLAAAAFARGSGVVDAVSDLRFGRQVDDAMRGALAVPDATFHTFVEALGGDSIAGDPAFDADLTLLSDTLLLAWYAPPPRPPLLDTFRRLFILYTFLRRSRTDPSVPDRPLEGLLALPVRPRVAPAVDEPAAARRRIASVGVADLRVVKQHIARYEATELAHIENIMSGETRTREHRSLDRLEETLTTEKERIVEQEKELETSERFEINKEASRTIKEDHKYAFDLSVTANYGPTVEVSSGFELDISESREEQSKSASKYAKDVVERSLERVTERVRDERIRTILRETEEKNLHSFVNGDDRPNKSGLYQFLDKVYKAQVFNYGKREMIDLMIPEPASYLWYLNRKSDSASRGTLPEPPEPLTINATDLLHGEGDSALPNHYTRLAQKYGATGITPPPDPTVTASASFQHPAEGGAPASEEGEVLTAPVKLEISIPPGYRPVRARFYCIALSDDSGQRAIPFSIGDLGATWRGAGAVSDGRLGINAGAETITFTEPPLLSRESKLVVTAVPYETANYTISAQVECAVSDGLLLGWKLTTCDRIRSAYLERVAEHRDEIARLQAEQKQQQYRLNPDFGVPPSKRRQLMLTELKKHCTAMFLGSWFTGTAVAIAGEPPVYDFDEALAKGSTIRFLEQSIEWTQLQYALYPYFWASHDTWEDRVGHDDADYEFRQFMQAGAARVVLPVRPKFEAAFNHFLETGEVWMGTGEPPTLTDPLYVSIVDELRDLTGGTLDEPEPVGDPWEIRVPTNLILLREDRTLPRWRQNPEGSWNWEPAV